MADFRLRPGHRLNLGFYGNGFGKSFDHQRGVKDKAAGCG